MPLLEALLGLNGLWQFEAALTAVLRITIVLGCAHAAVRLLPSCATRTRERILFLAVAALPLLPVVAATVPRVPLDVPVPASLNRIDNQVPAGEVRAGVARTLLGDERAADRIARDPAARGPGAFAWVFWAWLGVAALLLMRRIGALRRVHAVVAAAQPAPHALLACLERVCARHSIARRPALLMSDRFGTPAVCGVRRPAILLPHACTAWSTEQLELALAHEIVHVVRRDCLRELLMAMVGTLLWFHPLVWWTAVQRRRMAELHCDHHVLATGAPASAYAHLLLLVAQPRPAGAHGVVLFSAGDDLERRIRFVMRAAPAAHARLRTAALTLLLALATLAATALAARTVPCGPPAAKATVAQASFFCADLRILSHSRENVT